MIRRYGVLHPSQRFARRAFFLVDKQGIIRGLWLAEGDEVFPSEPILKVVREITQKP